jgi:hypothetical protein
MLMLCGGKTSSAAAPSASAWRAMRMTRGQEVSARGGEEMAAGEQPGAEMLPGIEGPLPRDIHKGMSAGAAHADILECPTQLRRRLAAGLNVAAEMAGDIDQRDGAGNHSRGSRTSHSALRYLHHLCVAHR